MINESIFDKLLRTMRLARVLPSIKSFDNPRLLDIGCGFEARLLREVEGYIAKGVGIDYKAPDIRTDKLHTFSYVFESKHELGLKASSRQMGGGRHRFSHTMILQNLVPSPCLLKTRALR